MTMMEVERAADPSGLVRRIQALAALAWISGYVLESAKLTPLPFAHALVLAGFVTYIVCLGALRNRVIRFWQSRPAPTIDPLKLDLPLTVGADPIHVRVRHSIGWLILLVSLLFGTLLLAAIPGGNSRVPIEGSLLLAIGVALGCAIAFVLLVKKKPPLTLSQDALSVGGQSVVLDSQTTCSFAGRWMVIGNPKIKIASLHGAVIFVPGTYYPGSSKYTAVNGSHLLYELAAKCSGGDAKAWLISTFPIVERPEVSARQHPITRAALAALGLLVVLLTALALSLPHH